MSKVTADDLYFAADWVEAYEAQDDDDNGERIERTVAYLRSLADVRAKYEHETAFIKQTKTQLGVTIPRRMARQLIERSKG